MTETRGVVELFAGPGGASEGMRRLGIDPIGIEWDASACATRAAAGHRTVRADVSQVPTGPFVGKVKGLWASPPCPTFSSAGDGSGREEMAWLLSFAEQFHKWGWRDPWGWHDWADPRTPLVLEPLRWVGDLNPEWVVLEQVPAVLDLWESFAYVWEQAGYSVAVGVLNAADFGVPQTRERAVLTASRTRLAVLPEPTHGDNPVPGLFGTLEPWVAMEDVLDFAGHHQMQQWRGAGMVERHGERPDRDQSEPAFTITGASTRTMRWVVDRRTNSRGPGGTIVPTVKVGVDRPAPTLTGKAGHQWVFSSECIEKRKLTVEEALILQTFPKDYPVQGGKTFAFQQIGNAVPPLLAERCVGVVA